MTESESERDEAIVHRWLCAHPIDSAVAFDARALEVFHTLARVGCLEITEHESGWLIAALSDGRVIAAAAAPSTLMLLDANHPRGIVIDGVATPTNFVAVHSHPQDTTFLRGHNLLRDAVLRAADAARAAP